MVVQFVYLDLPEDEAFITAKGRYVDSHSAGKRTLLRPRAHAQLDRFERLESRRSVGCANLHALDGSPPIAAPFQGHVLPCSSSLLSKEIVKRRILRSGSSRPAP